MIRYTTQLDTAGQPMGPMFLAAVVEMFPKCAGCGRVIRDGERVTACENRNRVVCAECNPQTEATAA